MLKVILVLVAVVGFPLLWVTVIVPLIGKFFGIPFKVCALPLDRREQRLSQRQSFWFGNVLGWGVGCCLLGILVERFVDRQRPPMLHLLLGIVCVLLTVAWHTQWADFTYRLDATQEKA